MWFQITLPTIFFLILQITQKNAKPTDEECNSITSCSSCLSKSFCVWCVNKGKCTRQSCGSDNHIHPKNVADALMSGPKFCPRVIESEKQMTFASGKRENIVVKITQIHIYMAFTPWKCKIEVDGKEMGVNALLIADEVYCEAVELINDTDNAYVNGHVQIFWEYTKAFDGLRTFRVCSCDLDPTCESCK
ncbi:uncharacterized protein LOC128671255 [Plodia interpunctella]|uniref:uncharacterized protein LOC128671255 n=1 Tax=Plodia interpunctella TaxID=58824 RepID=UPI0023680761|nr:uncharacterized protein LOC128671255 [Plodia interpunctella]